MDRLTILGRIDDAVRAADVRGVRTLLQLLLALEQQSLSQEAVRDEVLELRRLVKLLADLAVTESEIEQEFMHGPRVIFEKCGQIAVRDVLMARKALKRKPARAEWQCNRCPSPGGCALVEECALKREPNAAAEIGPESELGQNFLNALADETVEPAPAAPDYDDGDPAKWPPSGPTAPDVASMVKRLRDCCAMIGYATSGAERASHKRNADAAEAALLAKLGQEWIPVSGYAEARARFGGEGVKADKHSNAFIYFVDSKTQWFAMSLPPAPGASDD